MADEQTPITIEVPATTAHSTPTSITHEPKDKLEAFRRGRLNTLALPDNLVDLVFDITASITIPALASSGWASLPLPGFLKWGIVAVLIISTLTIWQLLEIPEIRGVLTFRLVLVALGVILGL